jgi:hypothetical protein
MREMERLRAQVQPPIRFQPWIVHTHSVHTHHKVTLRIWKLFACAKAERWDGGLAATRQNEVNTEPKQGQIATGTATPAVFTHVLTVCLPIPLTGAYDRGPGVPSASSRLQISTTKAWSLGECGQFERGLTWKLGSCEPVNSMRFVRTYLVVCGCLAPTNGEDFSSSWSRFPRGDDIGRRGLDVPLALDVELVKGLSNDLEPVFARGDDRDGGSCAHNHGKIAAHATITCRLVPRIPHGGATENVATAGVTFCLRILPTTHLEYVNRGGHRAGNRRCPLVEQGSKVLSRISQPVHSPIPAFRATASVLSGFISNRTRKFSAVSAGAYSSQ